MQAQPRRETKCEMAVRKAVHALGLRYRVHQRPEPDLRREADLVFRRDKVAVFVDGCFWHGCPEHHKPPTTHYHWWLVKVEKNHARDEETDRVLTERGWLVVRIWEHEDPAEAAQRVRAAVTARREKL
jgi:DNA mismatch endonuclease (patch repair protein)